MSNETLVRPEPVVKIFMGLGVISLITIAICQVIAITRQPQSPMMRRQVVPMENRMVQQGMPPMPPGMLPPGGPQGVQGMRPPQGTPAGQPPEVPAKK